ncbi:hypothetical protein [Longimicrobium sp.]|uniref:hypothetical protein n=1 Tax=Longimicrobium sp. TaxID=2029185 RepID=UPI002E3569DF|nr:hypothetical protein [Longimicrobium sp.]HEX6037248.1 hypothetical protein [Longimicrobium sp.]
MVETLLAIPGAIHAIREILAGRNSDPRAVLAHLETMRSSLVKFAEIGPCLDEIRKLHQTLQKVDHVLDPCLRYFARATASGYFNPVKYPLGKARSLWELAKPHSINEFIDSLSSLQFVEDGLHVKTPTGIRRIPRWSLETRNLKERVDTAFYSIDQRPPGSPQDVLNVAESLRDLSHHIKTRMSAADQEIRDLAAEISKVLANLERGLNNGR